MNKKRIDQLDILRGFMVILMVLGHSIVSDRLGNYSNNGLVWLFGFIYSFHMPVFFIISGYLYKTPNNYKRYIVKKIQRIGIPYIAFNLLLLIMQFLRDKVLMNSWGGIGLTSQFIRILLFGGNLWFLYVMLIIFIIYPFLERIIHNYILFWILMVLLGVLTYNFKLFCFNDLFISLFSFSIGNYIKNHHENIVFSKPNVYLIVGIFLIHAIVFSITFEICENIGYLKKLLSYFFALLGCLWVYSFSTYFNLVFIKKSLRRLSQYSIQIYLFNGYFLAASNLIHTYFWESSYFIASIFLNLLFAIILNCAFCQPITKIKFVRFITGGLSS